MITPRPYLQKQYILGEKIFRLHLKSHKVSWLFYGPASTGIHTFFSSSPEYAASGNSFSSFFSACKYFICGVSVKQRKQFFSHTAICVFFRQIFHIFSAVFRSPSRIDQLTCAKNYPFRDTVPAVQASAKNRRVPWGTLNGQFTHHCFTPKKNSRAITVQRKRRPIFISIRHKNQ